jgi:hypothetical protein
MVPSIENRCGFFLGYPRARLRLLLRDLKSRKEFRFGDGLLQHRDDFVLLQPWSRVTRDDDDADRKLIQFIDETVRQFAAAEINIDDGDMRKLFGEQPFGVRGACNGAGYFRPKRAQQTLYGRRDVPGVLHDKDPQTRKGSSFWLLVVVCCCHPILPIDDRRTVLKEFGITQFARQSAGVAQPQGRPLRTPRAGWDGWKLPALGRD